MNKEQKEQMRHRSQIWQTALGTKDKTLWDLLSLLIVPLVLTVGGIYFFNLQNARQTNIEVARSEAEKALEADRLQENALQAYFDQTTALLLDNNLRMSEPGDEVRSIARAATLTTLRQLNPERKTTLALFLIESQLIPIIDLSGADLSFTDLCFTDLSGAFLSDADLSRAVLREADLSGTDLSNANLLGTGLLRADLRGADLHDANLFSTDLRSSDLRFANLSGAALRSTDLSRSDLSGTDLRGAILSDTVLNGAKFNALTLWPDNFDPVAAGAINLDEE